jgi:hypothetical protein
MFHTLAHLATRNADIAQLSHPRTGLDRGTAAMQALMLCEGGDTGAA